MAKLRNKIKYYNNLVSNDSVPCAVIVIQQKKKKPILIGAKYLSFKICKIKRNL